MTIDELLVAAADETRQTISGLTPPMPRPRQHILTAVGSAVVLVAVLGLTIWATRFPNERPTASQPFRGADRVVEAVIQPMGGLSSEHAVQELVTIDDITIADTEVETVLDDGSGTVWLGIAETPPSQANGSPPVSIYGYDGAQWRGLDTPFYVLELLAADSESLWVLTAPIGVARFDGETWTSYGPEDGAPESYVNSATMAPDGSLWTSAIGNSLNGPTIATFDGQTWRSWRAPIGPNPTGQDLDAGQIALGPDGTVWIGSITALWGEGEPGGIWKLDGDTWVQKWAPTPAPAYFGALAVDADGGVWAGYREYILHLVDDTVELLEAPDLGRVSSYDVTAIEVVDDNVWFATLGDGVYRYSGGSWTFYGVNSGLPNPRVTDLAVDGDGSLWLAFSRSNAPERVVVFDPGK